jgi:DNA-binding response OmpR family regulator
VVDKILVADDEADIRNLVKIVLEKNGYQVVTASNGVEAEEKVESELPDAILLDVVMPEKGGFDVCRTIKANPKTQFIPVIMFTVLGRPIDKKMGAEAGAEGHFSKPFEPNDLLAEVKKHIEDSSKDRFSRALAISHPQLKGRKFLLEFNSTDPYERAVRDFVLEGRSQDEASVVVTHESSAIYNSVESEEEVKLAQFKIPMVLSRVLDPYNDKKLYFVFDSLSDLILSTGFQSAYNFIRDTLPRLSGDKTTAIFLLNPNSHALTEVQSMRNLFRDQLVFDEQGLRKIRLS